MTHCLDPKERIKEERDGIVLSPQRRSFGTGCHVTQQRRPPSPNEDPRDRRDQQRRIGSGRIQIDRERDRDRDFRNDRFDRDREERRDDRRFDRDRDRRFERVSIKYLPCTANSSI